MTLCLPLPSGSTRGESMPRHVAADIVMVNGKCSVTKVVSLGQLQGEGQKSWDEVSFSEAANPNRVDAASRSRAGDSGKTTWVSSTVQVSMKSTNPLWLKKARLKVSNLLYGMLSLHRHHSKFISCVMTLAVSSFPPPRRAHEVKEAAFAPSTVPTRRLYSTHVFDAFQRGRRRVGGTGHHFLLTWPLC